MNITIVLPTHNRLEYTRKCLQHLLADPTEEFELYIWDNASTDDTPEYLTYGLKDPRIVKVVLSRENLGQTGAMNYAWNKTKSELVGKLDNDCLVTVGWTRKFAQAHRDITRLGAVACWHFFIDDFDLHRAEKKIQRFGNHRIFRHPWVCGSGFIMKRSTYQRYGPWQPGPGVGTTYYFLKMALGGEINGWYYPFVLQEHLDDPKNPNCVIKDAESFRKYRNITFGLKEGRYSNITDRLKWRQEIVRNLLDDPFEPRYYLPWHRRCRAVKTGLKKLSGFQTKQHCG